jgi:hypothetical protein
MCRERERERKRCSPEVDWPLPPPKMPLMMLAMPDILPVEYMPAIGL